MPFRALTAARPTTMHTRPVRLQIYRTSVPMRSFEHAAASRSVAEAVVARLELSDGAAGWGETLPREYVTGESIDSVVADLSDFLWPALRDAWGAAAPPDTLDALDRLLPAERDGRCVNAARCCLELAVLAAVGPAELAAVRGRPIAARVTGVLGSADPTRTRKRLRLMRLFGLRDFKLKLGLGAEADAANLRVVQRRLGPALAAGRCTLRVDANGAWSADETPDRIAELRARGVLAVEQPVSAPAAELAELARRCSLPLIADESLLTPADAETLAAHAEHVWWNLRISKNGGLVRTLRLAELAARRGVTVVLGCMVG